MAIDGQHWLQKCQQKNAASPDNRVLQKHEKRAAQSSKIVCYRRGDTGSKKLHVQQTPQVYSEDNKTTNVQLLNLCLWLAAAPPTALQSLCHCDQAQLPVHCIPTLPASETRRRSYASPIP
jgi:hypothetical protein